MSWDDAVEFCEKLSALVEERAAGRKFRLPTEAEWEYACRAGTTTRFSFGDDPAGLANCAWFAENASGLPRPVGQKRPNAWGLYDMHGNMPEWCADWYAKDYYEKSPVDDPEGPATGSGRVTRGGGWFNTAGFRSADRYAWRRPTATAPGLPRRRRSVSQSRESHQRSRDRPPLARCGAESVALSHASQITRRRGCQMAARRMDGGAVTVLADGGQRSVRSVVHRSSRIA